MMVLAFDLITLETEAGGPRCLMKRMQEYLSSLCCANDPVLPIDLAHSRTSQTHGSYTLLSTLNRELSGYRTPSLFDISNTLKENFAVYYKDYHVLSHNRLLIITSSTFIKR